jgi:hypothetical protein
MATKRAICLLMLVGLTGCAAPAPSTAGPEPSTAGPAPAESRRPPRDPTDRIKDTAWVVGTVTAGGSGPCYSLMADDGTRYALHSTDGTSLVKGVRMRIRTERAKVRADCGAGKLVEMVAAEPLR